MRVEIDAEPGELRAKGAALLDHIRAAIVADGGAVAHHCTDPAHAHHAAPLTKGTDQPTTTAGAEDRLDAIPLPVVRRMVAEAQRLARALSRELTPILREALRDGPEGLAKAKRTPKPPRPLTLTEINLIAQLIRDGHVRLAVSLFGAESVSGEAIEGAIKRGVLKAADLKRAGIRGAIGGGYDLGSAMVTRPQVATGEPAGDNPAASVAGAINDPPPPAPPPKTAPPAPPPPEVPRWQRAYAEAARRHGAQMVVGLGNRTADKVAGAAMEVDEAQERKYRAAIAESTAKGIEAAQGWRSTRADIGSALDGDWTRDLDRIAVTETQAAVNQGYMDVVREDYGADVQVAVIPDPGACPVCLQSYLADGRPRVFKADALPPSSINFKRKVAEQVACIPPRHPWCACQLVYVEPGWGFDASWELVPAEVVAERDAAAEKAKEIAE